MVYSVQNLTTIPQCEKLLKDAETRRSILTANKIFAEYAISKLSDAQCKMKENIENLTSEIESVNTLIQLAKASETVNMIIDDRCKLEYKLMLLQNSRIAQNIEDLLGKELKLVLLVQEARVTEEFIIAVKKRKAALEK